MWKKIIRKIIKALRKISLSELLGSIALITLILYIGICILNVNLNNINLDGTHYEIPWWNFFRLFLV